ncbi:hypothetical protein BRC77_06965 [Halobacteriales archaeon QH_8_64_26]|nr:MAG: hypothetical protein BRC77_06965 [Halobacteriales archaeon QH_8_64_26]
MLEPFELNRNVNDETFYNLLKSFMRASESVASRGLSTGSFEPFVAGNRSFPCVDRDYLPWD